MLDTILHMILDGKIEVHQFLKSKKQLDFIKSQSIHHYDIEMMFTMLIMFDYVDYKKALPECPQDLMEFVAAVPQLSEDFESFKREHYIKTKQKYLEAVAWLDTEWNSCIYDATDWDLAVALALTEARQTLHEITYETAKQIVVGSVHNDNDKNKPWSGIADAQRYIRERMREDMYDAGSIEGGFQENLPLMEQDLLDRLKEPDQQRCYTGFPGIDETQLIGPSQDIRTVGIAGYTNQGKTLVMMTML